jgi:hypothetical protein
MLTGKATRILNRFPDFYHSENPEALLPQLIDLFGQILDQTEADLTEVMRSHYVDTANNWGSQGLAAQEKGDLDRIFSLYLETLGGTSRLTQVNQTFQNTDIRQLSDFIEEIIAAQSPISQDVWSRLPGPTQDLLQCYRSIQATFSAGFSRAFVIRLIAAQDALTLYLRSQFSAATEQALDHYDGTEAIAPELDEAIATELNQLLRSPKLKYKFAERQAQIQVALLIQGLLGQTDRETQQQTIAQQLRKRLSLDTQRLLIPLPKVRLEPDKLPGPLAEELPLLLKQPSFCQSILNIFADPEPAIAPSEALRLSSEAIAILLQSAQDSLANIILGSVMGERSSYDLQQPALTAEVERLMTQGAVGDDLARLNRQLLEAAYRDLPVSNIPTALEVQHSLVQALNENILSDADFDGRHRSHFTELELPKEVHRLRLARQETNNPAQQTKLLQQLNRLLLETTYPNYLEKSYTPYRERLRHLITVLKNGASTKAGIVDIAAANLGIPIKHSEGMVKPWEAFLFDLPLSLEPAFYSLTVSPDLRQAFFDRGIGISYNATVAMETLPRRWVITDISSAQVYGVYRNADRLSIYRSLIRVIEFLPESQSIPYEVHPHPTIAGDSVELLLPTTFNVANPNALITTPAVQVKIRDRRSDKSGILSPLINLKLSNTTTRQYVEYQGSLNCDEVILFLPDGAVLINGVAVSDPHAVIQGRVPDLPIGSSNWTIEALTGSALATLETSLFDFCRFDQEEVEELDEARSSSYRLEVLVMFVKLTPGSFIVKIPWDIPGYTDQFNETEDHPRHEISRLLEKVKASGVQSVVTYEKQFVEVEEMIEILTVKRSPFSEVHDITALNPVIRSQQKPYGLGVEHEITDKLVTSAMFDYTSFDSLNTFG